MEHQFSFAALPPIIESPTFHALDDKLLLDLDLSQERVYLNKKSHLVSLEEEYRKRMQNYAEKRDKHKYAKQQN